MLDYLEFGGLSDLGSEPSAQVSNQTSPATQRRGGRVILLVVDDLSARPAQMVALRTAAQHMLATLDLGDSVGLATTQRPWSCHQPDEGTVGGEVEHSKVGRSSGATTRPRHRSTSASRKRSKSTRSEVRSLPTRPPTSPNNATTFANVVNRECRLFMAPGERADDTVFAAKVQRAAVHLAESIIHRASAQLAAYGHLIDALRACSDTAHHHRAVRRPRGRRRPWRFLGA